MNYAGFIVKILGKPEQSFFDDDISVTEVLVKFYQIKNTDSETILQLSVWGKLAYDMAQYYQVGDYILIEGFISLRGANSDKPTLINDKQVEISAHKIYPLSFGSK